MHAGSVGYSFSLRIFCYYPIQICIYIFFRTDLYAVKLILTLTKLNFKKKRKKTGDFGDSRTISVFFLYKPPVLLSNTMSELHMIFYSSHWLKSCIFWVFQVLLRLQCMHLPWIQAAWHKCEPEGIRCLACWGVFIEIQWHFCSSDTFTLSSLFIFWSVTLQPQDAYGLEKLATEELCKHYTKDFGIECRIGRFHNIYGPFGTWKGKSILLQCLF